jgi:ferredoxin-NADP reductase
MPEERRTVRVVARAEVADGVAQLDLVAADGDRLPAWEPGAHIDVHAPEGLVRQYSLCGEPGATRWRIAVLRAPDSRGGSTWVHSLAEGDRIEVTGPRNHFPLRPADDYLFIAGGIGITPLLPMIRTVADGGPAWRLVYGGRRRASMAFGDVLAELAGDRLRLVPEEESGPIDLAGELGDPRPGRRVYCCGPEPLLHAVEDLLSDRPEQLHVERFAPAEPVDTSGDAFEVELATSGRRVSVAADQSIIDALADAGVEVDHSCQEGTCGTCETAVLAGVPDHRDSILSTVERAANDCMMICVGRCVEGPLVLDL